MRTQSSTATRIGIIGAGQIVENVHLPVLLNVPEVEVCWIADTDYRRAQLLERMFRVTSIAAAEIEGHLGEVDACLMAIPLGARSAYLDACAKRRCAVLCEKPFAVSSAEHERLCEAFDESYIGVCFQRRCYSTVVTITEIVRSQLFGELESVALRIGGFDLKSGGPRRYLTDPRLAGGGIIAELAVHGLDQILICTEASDIKVDSVQAISMHGIDYDAITETTINTPQGSVRARCEATRLRPIDSGFRFVFTKATVAFGLGPNDDLLVEPRAGGQPMRLIRDCEGARTVNEAFYCLWSKFIDGIVSGQRSLASASTSKLTTKWVESIYARIRND